MLQRSEIRKRTQPHLAGDTAMDLLKAVCCGCCDLMQQDKEAEFLLGHESSQYVTEQPTAMKQDMSYAAPAAITSAPIVDPAMQQQTYHQDQKVVMWLTVVEVERDRDPNCGTWAVRESICIVNLFPRALRYTLLFLF